MTVCWGVCLSACFDTLPRVWPGNPWVWAWRPPWVWAWRPPRCEPETPLWCGPGAPQAKLLNFPPGCGPGDPPRPDPLTSPLGVGLGTCKACWDTTPPGYLQGMLGYHPPCGQNSWHTLLKILSCPKLRLRAVKRTMDKLFSPWGDPGFLLGSPLPRTLVWGVTLLLFFFANCFLGITRVSFLCSVFGIENFYYFTDNSGMACTMLISAASMEWRKLGWLGGLSPFTFKFTCIVMLPLCDICKWTMENWISWIVKNTLSSYIQPVIFCEMRFWGTLHCGHYDQNLTAGVVYAAFQFAFEFEVISSAEWVPIITDGPQRKVMFSEASLILSTRRDEVCLRGEGVYLLLPTRGYLSGVLYLGVSVLGGLCQGVSVEGLFQIWLRLLSEINLRYDWDYSEIKSLPVIGQYQLGLNYFIPRFTNK